MLENLDEFLKRIEPEIESITGEERDTASFMKMMRLFNEVWSAKEFFLREGIHTPLVLWVAFDFQSFLFIFFFHFFPHFYIVVEHTCAYARWAHMHRFLSVRLVSLDQNSRLEVNSYLWKFSSEQHEPKRPKSTTHLQNILISLLKTDNAHCQRIGAKSFDRPWALAKQGDIALGHVWPFVCLRV